MKALRFACILCLAGLTLPLACSKKNGPKPEPAEYKWTILGYFDGNNSQDEAPDGQSYVIKDLQELEQIDSTEDVHVVVMLGSFKTDGNCKYYHVERHLNEPPDVVSSEVLLDLGRKDMSDAMTLRDFISFGVQKYPAERYMLIINDHGGGWRGLCSDIINGDGNWMSLPELASALSGFEFDIIWFYTPSMAAAEVAYQIRDRAEYMIASQFKWYPKNIMGSTEWLPTLTGNPDINLRNFAVGITEAIFNAIDGELGKRVHSVLLHLPKIPQLASDVSILATALKEGTGSYWPEVWNAWQISHNFFYSESSFVDLREFARQIQSQPNLDSAARAAALEVEVKADDAVLAEFIYPPNAGDFGGISIHLPWNKENFDSTGYAQLDFSETAWSSFIPVFIQSFSHSHAGALNIITIPSGARVFLNDADTGYETNVIIGDLVPAAYRIKLVKQGYPVRTVDEQVSPRDTALIILQL